MLTSKIKLIFKSNFVKDAAILQIGTFISTGLSFVASVVFARFLGPDNYGQYALIFAFTGLVGVFMNFGEDQTMLTLLSEAWAKKDKLEITHLIVFFIKLSLCVALTIGLASIILSPWLTQWLYRDPMIGQLARWVLLATLIKLFFFLLTIILQVARRIKYLTVIENINKIVYIIVPILLVIFGYGLKGVVWGNFLSALIFVFLAFYFYLQLLKRTDLLPNFREIMTDFKKAPFKKYFKFGFSIAVDKNLSTLYSVLPVTFLGMLVASAQVGYFKIAFSYVCLSLMLLKPISRLLAVQLPQSKIQGNTKLREHFFKTAFYSFLMMAGVIVPMMFLAKFLVVVFYGVNYLPSVNLVYLLAPYPLVISWSVGFGPIFRTLNKMKTTILINSVNLLLGAPVFYWLIYKFGVVGMALGTTLWLGSSILISSLVVRRYFKIL